VAHSVLRTALTLSLALLGAGADVNLPDKAGATALDHARRRHCRRIMQILREAGARR